LPELVDAVGTGESILLADGRLKLEVVSTQPPDQFTCRVVIGGTLSSGKGVNLPQSQLSISALTEKDLQDIAFIAPRDFDYVALSFVQKADDISQLRALLTQHGSDARIIAKIEKPQALNHIDDIIEAADAIMVARGDLGVEMDFPSVPIAQKTIAHKCERAGKPCIIATEMLESMITSPRPTRAEVSDVANAVFDRADAVMLSAESAIGKYPVAAVTAMRQTVNAADTFQDAYGAPVHLVLHQASTTAALAGALREIMQIQPIAAVAVFTVSGNTARLIAKNRPPCPIVALSANMSTLRRCCLYHGVMPHLAPAPKDTIGAVQMAARVCSELGMARPGERIIILAGHPFDLPGNTNGLVVMTME
jgi:pyruvate kinase